VAVTKHKPAEAVYQWNGATYSLVLRRLAPGVFYSEPSGTIDEFIPDLAKIFEDEIAHGARIVVFTNMLELSIASEARKAWTTWGKTVRLHIVGHCLVRSRLTEMALSLIWFVGGGAQTGYTDPDLFLAAMRRLAPGAALPQLRKSA